MLASPLPVAQWTTTAPPSGQSDLSPLAFWQDLLAPQEMAHNITTITTTTSGVNSSSSNNNNSNIASHDSLHLQHNDNVSFSLHNNQHVTASMSAHTAGVGAVPSSRMNHDSFEDHPQGPAAPARDSLATLATVSAQYLTPLISVGSQADHEQHHHRNARKADDSLSALAAITAQHPAQASGKLSSPLSAISTISRADIDPPQLSVALAASAGRDGLGEGRNGPSGKTGAADEVDVAQRPCDVCGETASGHYFGALVCLPCKSFFIRCTKGGEPTFSPECGGKCDVQKSGRIRCQYCRFQKCLAAGMYRKEKPEAVVPGEGQVLCKVCNDIANGVHFGVTTCEGCKKFFRRGLKEHQTYVCRASRMCTINPRMRNNCRYCRYRKCLRVGMSREAIKMGRPKKGDNVCVRPLRPAQSGDRRLTYQSSESETSVSGSPEAEGSVGSGREVGTLDPKFTLEAVCDSSYLSDEFLEAVSIDLGGSGAGHSHNQSDNHNHNHGHRQAGVKKESAMTESEPPDMSEPGPIVSMAASPTPSSCSSTDNVCISPPGSPLPPPPPPPPPPVDTPRPSQSLPHPPPPGPPVTHVAPVVSGFAFRQPYASSSPSLSRQRSQGQETAGQWAANEDPRQGKGVITPAVAAYGFPHSECSECYPLSPSFVAAPARGWPVVSPPCCCCDPCSCGSPVSDCDSPDCPADYRCHLGLLDALSTAPAPQQPLPASPRISAVSRAARGVFQSRFEATRPYPGKLPAPAHGAPVTSWHSFPQAGYPPQPRQQQQQQQRQREEAEQVPVIRRNGVVSPALPRDLSLFGTTASQGKSSGSPVLQLNVAASAKVDLAAAAETGKHQGEGKEGIGLTDDLYELLETLSDKAPVAGETAHGSSVAEGGGRLEENGVKYRSATPESRRRQSDSVLDYLPNAKRQRLHTGNGTPWDNPAGDFWVPTSHMPLTHHAQRSGGMSRRIQTSTSGGWMPGHRLVSSASLSSLTSSAGFSGAGVSSALWSLASCTTEPSGALSSSPSLPSLSRSTGELSGGGVSAGSLLSGGGASGRGLSEGHGQSSSHRSSPSAPYQHVVIKQERVQHNTAPGGNLCAQPVTRSSSVDFALPRSEAQTSNGDVYNSYHDSAIISSSNSNSGSSRGRSIDIIADTLCSLAGVITQNAWSSYMSATSNDPIRAGTLSGDTAANISSGATTTSTTTTTTTTNNNSNDYDYNDDDGENEAFEDIRDINGDTCVADTSVICSVGVSSYARAVDCHSPSRIIMDGAPSSHHSPSATQSRAPNSHSPTRGMTGGSGVTSCHTAGDTRHDVLFSHAPSTGGGATGCHPSSETTRGGATGSHSSSDTSRGGATGCLSSSVTTRGGATGCHSSSDTTMGGATSFHSSSSDTTRGGATGCHSSNRKTRCGDPGSTCHCARTTQKGAAPSATSACSPASTSLEVDLQALQNINAYFLALDNACRKDDCEDVLHHAMEGRDTCSSSGCPVCHQSGDEGETRDGSPRSGSGWQRVCPRRHHAYWHGHSPSPVVVHMTAHNQRLLGSVASALCLLRDRLAQPHGAGPSPPAPAEGERQDTFCMLLERLGHQGAELTAVTKHFMLQIPGGDSLATGDVDLLSQQYGFGSVLIMLSSEAFDVECRRFRELWSWAVAPSSPLFPFQDRLLALAGHLHSIGMDKMETALLCALSLFSTDVSGLKDKEAVKKVRTSLLHGLEAYISSRDQWFGVRVKRLFSPLPDVRLISAWHNAVLFHSHRSATLGNS